MFSNLWAILIRRLGPACVIAAAGWTLTGCANPGPPRPPSLELPTVVRDLRLTRIAQRVQADWTTSRLTTEKTGIPGPITAVLCRDRAAEAAAAAPGNSAGSGSLRVLAGCVEVARQQVIPGPGTLTVDMPTELASGAARLLAYRLELLSPHGRSAGYSQLAWAAGGTAPQAAGKVEAQARRAGVEITWATATVTPANGSMELVRRTVSAAPAPVAATYVTGALGNVGSIAAKATGVEEIRLTSDSSGEGIAPERPEGKVKTAQDRGGLVDTSTVSGATYRYVAQRVRRVALDGHALLIEGEASAPVEVTYRDIFPPSSPQSLQAIPVGELSAGATLAIDLSWEPSPEDDVAGYNVLRRDASGNGEEIRLNASPVSVPAYRDRTVAAGKQYVYQITAVDSHGNVSAPGTAVHVNLSQ